MFVSRAVKVAVLFSLEEIKELFEEFPAIVLLNTSSVCEEGEESVSKELFYEAYAKYIAQAKLSKEYLSPRLTLAMSVDPEATYAMQVGQGRVLLRAKKPVIQVRPYHYSLQEGKILSMSFQKDKIFWGLEFSYPQIFAPSRDAPIERVWRNPQFPNSILFVKMLKWIYEASVLHPPARMGKRLQLASY